MFCNTSRFLILQNWVAAFSFKVPLADGASHNILLLETCLMLQLTTLYKNSHFSLCAKLFYFSFLQVSSLDKIEMSLKKKTAPLGFIFVRILTTNFPIFSNSFVPVCRVTIL